MKCNRLGIIRRSPRQALQFIVLVLVASMTFGCSAPFPTSRGRILIGPLHPENDGYRTTLQVRWLGTTCYLIQLGDVAILTDPFVSYSPATQVALGQIESDVGLVDSLMRPLPVADAIFVGHSHYDHMLDLAATLQLPGWHQVPVLGSLTTCNILHGYGDDLHRNWRQARTDGNWQTITAGLKYLAVRSEHAPNLRGCGTSYTFAPGKAAEPLTSPPRRAVDFPMGDTYTYVFELSNAHDDEASRHVTYTVFFAGSASNDPIGLPPDTVKDVDLAILCVPGWKNVTGYPQKFIERLRPRNILLTHYDNFLDRRREKSRVVATAHLDEFVSKVQETAVYPDLERILVPDVGAVMHMRKP